MLMLPVVDRRVSHALAPRKIACLGAGFGPPQHAYDQLFREPHASSSLLPSGRALFVRDGKSGGQVITEQKAAFKENARWLKRRLCRAC